MSKVGQVERRTQDRVIALFQRQLGYRYLGNWKDRPNNRPIEEGILRESLLNRGYSDALAARAIRELVATAGNDAVGLYYRNKDVYSLLRFGVAIKMEVGQTTQTVHLIDWEQTTRNDFAIAQEVTVNGVNDKRPDIVLYINGIAVGVLELKRSTVPVSEAIRQNLDNQQSRFIQPFFAAMQLVMAGNDTEGLRYGTIETGEKYYLAWKEESAIANLLDRALVQICERGRLLEIIHDFIVFEGGVKKLCRPHQYFGVKAAQPFIDRREGGIIWHTQGSGKSLTMVWLAHWIREHIANARILIVTDRTELDEQIEGIFLGVNEQIYRTKSGSDLVAALQDPRKPLICSLIHKFAGKDEGDIEGFISELRQGAGGQNITRDEIIVFVDECHRTQSGKLNTAMKAMLPNAVLIGFTGTPLLKKDKKTSIETFGRYIHTYKFDEAVGDEVVLDLRYEARDIDQYLTSPEKIDAWFDAKTRGLNEVARARLKQKWGTMQKVLSSRDRLDRIVADIIFDMGTKDRLASGRGNAMLVCSSIYQACTTYAMFIEQGFTQCAIVTSYRPSVNDTKGESTGERLTERLKQYEIYNAMLKGEDPEAFEKRVKEQFIKEPGQMKLLIVVDKLLTGFDAPSATYLYIDKPMRDHGLFQAICRVNRLDGEDKQYGYIIDYKDLFKSLEQSIHDYTSGALDGYEAADVAGLIKDRITDGRTKLDTSREAVSALCDPVEPPKDTEAYIKYFCGPDDDEGADYVRRRTVLYRLVGILLHDYAAIANDLAAAGYTADEIRAIAWDVDHYTKVRTEIRLASGDYIDLKLYEPGMRTLIDTYIRAEDSRKLAGFDEKGLIELLAEGSIGALDELPEEIRRNPNAMAETIENNMRRTITDEMEVNPNYYTQMSKILNELIQARKQKTLEYEEYLKEIVELAGQVHNPSKGRSYPSALNTPGKRALYDNLSYDADRALAVDEVVRRTKKDEWRGHPVKELEVHNAILGVVGDTTLAQTILMIVKAQDEY